MFFAEIYLIQSSYSGIDIEREPSRKIRMEEGRSVRPAEGRACSRSDDQHSTFSVPYSALTDCFEEIDKTTKRLQISSLLTKFLLKVTLNPGKDGGDLLRVVYLCINRVSGPETIQEK